MKMFPAMRIVRSGVMIFLFSAIVVFPYKTHAAEIQRTEMIITETIQTHGMTFADADNAFRLGVRPYIIEGEKIILQIQQEDSLNFSMDNEKLRSSLYSYAFTAKKGNAIVREPLWISLYWEKRPTRVTLKYWNEATSTWTDIPTSFDKENKRLQGSLGLANATIGIFKTNPAIAGQASWYDWHGAAMNIFPIGTEVIVTNPSNGKKARTRIVSTGPYTPGRIIDLPRSVFEKIGNLWDGVMDVTVQPVRLVSRQR